MCIDDCGVVFLRTITRRIKTGMSLRASTGACDRAGPLDNARYLEPLSMLNIQLGRFLGLGTQIGFTLLKTSLTGPES
jgi:hypothetical protein